MIQIKSMVNCIFCGTIKPKKRSNILRHPKSFCTKICLKKYNKQKNWKTVQCEQCKKNFEKQNSQIKKSNRNYCSKKCYNNSKFSGKNIPCSFCKSLIYRSKHRLELFNFHYCNHHCREKHLFPNKKQNIKLTNKKTPNCRNKALKYYGLICQNKECLLKNNEIKILKCYLDVDHIDSDRTNNSIENLAVLCVFCHREKTLLSIKKKRIK